MQCILRVAALVTLTACGAGVVRTPQYYWRCEKSAVEAFDKTGNLDALQRELEYCNKISPPAP